MESTSSKSDEKCSDNGSTDSSTTSDLPNDRRNSSGSEYNANEECSGVNVSTSVIKTTATLQNGNHDKNHLLVFHGNLYIKIQTLNPSTVSVICNEPKSCDPRGCDTCKMQEPSKECLSDDKQIKKLPVCNLENKCANWFETTYTLKYGCEYTEDLVFAIDIAMVAMSTHGLAFRSILYPTTTKAPKSPCAKMIIAKALLLIWQGCGKAFDRKFDLAMNGLDVTYKNFQDVLLKNTKNWEDTPYKAKGFLMHSAMVMRWTYIAEKKGISRAFYFSPLVICRTIKHLRIGEKVNQTFWTDLDEAANLLLDSYSKIFE